MLRPPASHASVAMADDFEDNGDKPYQKRQINVYLLHYNRPKECRNHPCFYRSYCLCEISSGVSAIKGTVL